MIQILFSKLRSKFLPVRLATNSISLRIFAAYLLASPDAQAQSIRPPLRVDGRVGETLRLTATAEGDQAFNYIWSHNGRVIPDSNRAVLVIPIFQLADAGTYEVRVTNEYGSAASEPLTLNVTPLVAVVSSEAPVVGGGATLSVSRTSFPVEPLGYQWRRDGVNIPRQEGPALVLSGLADQDFATYSVLVKLPNIDVVSTSVSLAPPERVPGAPTITTQPTDITIRNGGTLTLLAKSSGTPVPRYQWRHNGSDLFGATSEILVINDAKAGEYSVVATNALGSVVSRTATVRTANGLGRLVNVSSLTQILSGERSQTTGFVVGGRTSQRLLIRSVGPTLAAFGISDALTDPAIELVDSAGLTVSRNDNWGDSPTEAAIISSASTAAGAYALLEASLDAAMVVNLPPGAYTLRTTGSAGITSTTEVYDLSSPTSAGPRLINLSRRDAITRSGEILLSGFVVDGTVAKTLLIRAIGPAMKLFGVETTLAQPRLILFDHARQVVAENRAWESTGASQALISAAARVGAFSLPRGSRDCALLVTLPPGSYTAQVSAVGEETGEVLLEVYELP